MWVLQKLDALPITRSNSNSQKENTRNTINFTTQYLQIDVTMNIIGGLQQPIKCTFELLFVIDR